MILNTKTIILFLALAGSAGVFYYIYDKKRRARQKLTAESDIYYFTDAERGEVIKAGSRGKNVKAFQIFLNERGANLDIDGIFGAKTEAASLAQSGHDYAIIRMLGIVGIDEKANKIIQG